MQKAKKMSKQTLVIAVLAVLLVLSLALSVTGAWFTDTATDTAKKDIQFGTVSVAATDASATVTGDNFAETKRQLLLPGDKVSLGGEINNTGSTVAVYIGIKIGAISVMGTTAESWTKDMDASNYTIDLTEALAGDAALSMSGTTGVEGVEVVSEEDAEILILKVESAKSFNYSGEFTIPTTTGNFVEGKLGEGTVKCALNKDAADIPVGAEVITGVRISATVDVVALQVDNVPTDATEGSETFADIIAGLFTPAN